MLPMHAYLSESLHLTECLCKTALCLFSRIPMDWGSVRGLRCWAYDSVLSPGKAVLGVLPSEEHLLGTALSPS